MSLYHQQEFDIAPAAVRSMADDLRVKTRDTYPPKVVVQEPPKGIWEPVPAVVLTAIPQEEDRYDGNPRTRGVLAVLTEPSYLLNLNSAPAAKIQ
ncbi:unnamed protein product [Haemonchus placei]|uniref:ZM domain-containing protein n=1 Tax=Haemonchus placei TaxID=6290 RepID=A0A0N4WCX5_HAEPC|nr:unnamed protein product [Haemonchus placei]